MSRNSFYVYCTLIIMIASLALSIGCGLFDNEAPKLNNRSNGNRIIKVPKGMKVVFVTHNKGDVNITYRPFKRGEEAETYYTQHESGFSLITIVEEK